MTNVYVCTHFNRHQNCLTLLPFQNLFKIPFLKSERRTIFQTLSRLFQPHPARSDKIIKK